MLNLLCNKEMFSNISIETEREREGVEAGGGKRDSDRDFGRLFCFTSTDARMLISDGGPGVGGGGGTKE